MMRTHIAAFAGLAMLAVAHDPPCKLLEADALREGPAAHPGEGLRQRHAELDHHHALGLVDHGAGEGLGDSRLQLPPGGFGMLVQQPARGDGCERQAARALSP